MDPHGNFVVVGKTTREGAPRSDARCGAAIVNADAAPDFGTHRPYRVQAIINVTTWQVQSDEQARELMTALTNAVNEVTGAPLDKITVCIQEIPRNRWAEAGSLGSDADFPTASRRQK